MLFDANIYYDLNDSANVLTRLSNLYESGRLPHALLLFSENQQACDDVAYGLANKILQCESCDKHLDFFQISLNKSTSGQITIDMVRDLIDSIQTSPKIAQFKIVYIPYVDKMNKYAANSFLKTLEEPPRNTVIILSTSNQYALLPTILSRCVLVKLSDKALISNKTLEHIANLYESWLEMLHTRSRKNLAIMEMYKLLTYIEQHLDVLVDDEGKNKIEAEAILLKTLEASTAKMFKKHEEIILKLYSVISIFEHSRYFLSINCGIVAYLERCFIIIFKFFEKERSDNSYN